MIEMLSEHFSRKEIERNNVAARNGLDNTIPEEQLEFWKMGCSDFLEPLRDLWQRSPIYISCGYRSTLTNAQTIGSSANSAHRGFILDHEGKELKSCAFDIDQDVYGESNLDLFHLIRTHFEGLYDQCIWETGWVHLGLSEKPRGQTLVKRPKQPYTIYHEGILL